MVGLGGAHLGHTGPEWRSMRGTVGHSESASASPSHQVTITKSPKSPWGKGLQFLPCLSLRRGYGWVFWYEMVSNADGAGQDQHLTTMRRSSPSSKPFCPAGSLIVLDKRISNGSLERMHRRRASFVSDQNPSIHPHTLHSMLFTQCHSLIIIFTIIVIRVHLLLNVFSGRSGYGRCPA